MKVEDKKVGRRPVFKDGPPEEGAYITGSSFARPYFDELIDSVGQAFWLGALGGFVYGSVKSRRVTLSQVPRAAGFFAVFSCLAFDAAPQIGLLNLLRGEEWYQELNWPLTFGAHAAGGALVFAPRGFRYASSAALLSGAVFSSWNPLCVYLMRRC